MLSLTPRYDLFRILLPPEFIPQDIKKKYNPLINSDPMVITNCIDYLNESIKTITFPGFTDLIQTQRQTSTNTGIVVKENSLNNGLGTLGRINRESVSEVPYYSSMNPLDKIDKTFAITFRLNQGLYNYFILLETIYHRYLRDINYQNDKILDIKLQILSESGRVSTEITFENCVIDGLEGLEFSYDKVERSSDAFQCNFKFMNLKIDFRN